MCIRDRSTAYLILRYIFRDKTYRITIKEFVRDRGTPYKTLLRQFFAITLPIIVSSITVHLMGLIDAFFVMQRLKGNFSIDYAQLLWGSYSNMSLTIFNLPSFLIITIGVSLVPVSYTHLSGGLPVYQYKFSAGLSLLIRYIIRITVDLFYASCFQIKAFFLSMSHRKGLSRQCTIQHNCFE